jgi:hypothetical protein
VQTAQGRPEQGASWHCAATTANTISGCTAELRPERGRGKPGGTALSVAGKPGGRAASQLPPTSDK